MAKITSLLQGTGKIGNVILTSTAGETIARQYQPNVSNPSTSAQVDQRARFKLMSQIAAAMAPALAIQKSGLSSARNIFVARNSQYVLAQSGVAQVTYENLQLTTGTRALPSIFVTRGDETFSVRLAEIASSEIKRVLYFLYKKNAEDLLEFVASAVSYDPQNNQLFNAELVGFEGDAVIFAYGMVDLNGQATAKYNDYTALEGQDIARLYSSRSISATSAVFTRTRGTTLYADDRETQVVSGNQARVFVTALGPGEVSGGGIVRIGSDTTVVATPNSNARFLGWRNNDGNLTYISTAASYTFRVTGQRDLIAVFETISYTSDTNFG